MGNAVINASPIAASTTLVTTTETVVATVQVTTALPGQRVVLSGRCSLTPGTTANAAILRIRRGATVADTQIAITPNLTIVAAAPITVGLDGVDQPGEYAGPYVLSVVQLAATANGTVVAAELTATVI